MSNDMKVYSINFFGWGVNLDALTQYLYDSADIAAFWNYIPLVYCVKTHLTAAQLSLKLFPFFPSGRFMVAEIVPANIDGRLPPEAWTWFYQPHHHKEQRPSVQPSLFYLPP